MNYEEGVFKSLDTIITYACKITTMMERGDLSCNLNDRARVRFLWDTVLRVSSHVSEQPEERKDLDIFKTLIKIINNRMIDVENVLRKMHDGEICFTVNFDMLELVLRGQLEELVVLFPVPGDIQKGTQGHPRHRCSGDVGESVWDGHILCRF